VGIDWAAGGKGNPQYGNPVYLGISFAVLIFILLITRYAKGFMSNVAVLLGIVFGFLLSWMMNEVNLSGLHDASWRSTFGRDIYINSGSHGCINLPTGFAGSLYSQIYVNLPVVVYR